MITRDRRTDAQREALPFLVVGTDRFMSGWGGAEGGLSYAAWACSYDAVDRVYREIDGRGDMQRVRIVSAQGYSPRGAAHLSIYVWKDHWEK